MNGYLNIDTIDAACVEAFRSNIEPLLELFPDILSYVCLKNLSKWLNSNRSHIASVVFTGYSLVL